MQCLAQSGLSKCSWVFPPHGFHCSMHSASRHCIYWRCHREDEIKLSVGSQPHSQIYCLAPLLSIFYPVVPSNTVIEKRRLLLLNSARTLNTSLVTVKCKTDMNTVFQLLDEVISWIYLSFLIPGMTATVWGSARVRWSAVVRGALMKVLGSSEPKPWSWAPQVCSRSTTCYLCRFGQVMCFNVPGSKMA